MVAGRVVSLVGAGILALSATPAVASEDPGRWMRTGDVWRFRLATVCGHAACSVPDGATGAGWRCPVQPDLAQPDQTMTGPGLFVEAPATMRLNLDTAELARRVAVVCARLSSLPPGKLSALAATGELADGVTQSAEQAAVADAEARALAGQFAEEAARVTSQAQAQAQTQTQVGDFQNRPLYVAESQVAPPVQAFAVESMVAPPMEAQRPVHVPADPSTRETAVQPRTRQTEGRDRPRVRAAEERGRSRARGEKRHRPRIREAEIQSWPETHARDEQGWPGGSDRQGPPEFREGGEQHGPKGHQLAEPVAQPQAMPGIPMPEMPGNVNPGQSPLVDSAPGQQPNFPPAPQPGQEAQVAPGQMAVGEQPGPGVNLPQAAPGAPVEVPQPMPNAAPAPGPGEQMQEPLSGGLSNLPPLPQLPPGPPLPPGMVEGGTPPELLMPMATPAPSGPPLTRSLNNTQAIAQEDSGLELVKGWPGVVAAIAALIAVLALQMRLGRRKVVSDPQPK